MYIKLEVYDMLDLVSDNETFKAVTRRRYQIGIQTQHMTARTRPIFSLVIVEMQAYPILVARCIYTDNTTVTLLICARAKSESYRLRSTDHFQDKLHQVYFRLKLFLLRNVLPHLFLSQPHLRELYDPLDIDTPRAIMCKRKSDGLELPVHPQQDSKLMQLPQGTASTTTTTSSSSSSS